MKNKIKSISKRSIAIVVVLVIAALLISGSIAAVSAGDALSTAMDSVLTIIETAAKYVGIVIALWGIFQIILALRREDSEGISKQIITVVVGATLTTIGFSIRGIYSALGGE
jgi:hypothetical protein